MNKDLVLREHLAIERTRLANERTLLTYIRTGLYFIVAGSTLGEVIDTIFWKVASLPLVIVGLLIITFGAIRFRKVKRSIELSKANIGNVTDEFMTNVRGGA